MQDVKVQVQCSAGNWGVIINGSEWCNPLTPITTRPLNPGLYGGIWHMLGKSTDKMTMTILVPGNAPLVQNFSMQPGQSIGGNPFTFNV